MRSLYLGRERSIKDCRKEARTEETTTEKSKIREQEGCRMFLGSCCQTPVSVSLLATSKGICYKLKTLMLSLSWKSRSKKGLLLYLVSCTLLFLMTFSSSDLLPLAWKATLSPAFPGFLAILIPLFFTLSLHCFLLVSYTVKNSYCSLAARIEFLGI